MKSVYCMIDWLIDWLIFNIHPRAPGSFGRVDNLRKYARKRRKRVVDHLAGQDAYTFHNAGGITHSKDICDLYQIDQIDWSNMSRKNDKCWYLLNCSDEFTKRAWSVPLKTKTGREVSDAFEGNILYDRLCVMLQSDKGTEFVNSTFQSTLRRRRVEFYTKTKT